MADHLASPRPAVVLIHGAFADASGWNDIASTLFAPDSPVVALADPQRRGRERGRPARQVLRRDARAAHSAWRRHKRHVDPAGAVSRPVLRQPDRDAGPLHGRFAAPGHRPRTQREGQPATPPACSCSAPDNSLLRLFTPVAERLQERMVHLAIKAQLAGRNRPGASARRPSVGVGLATSSLLLALLTHHRFEILAHLPHGGRPLGPLRRADPALEGLPVHHGASCRRQRGRRL